MDGMHQFGRQVEIVKAGFAFLWLYNKVFGLPGDDRWFWRAFTTRALGLGLFDFWGFDVRVLILDRRAGRYRFFCVVWPLIAFGWVDGSRRVL